MGHGKVLIIIIIMRTSPFNVQLLSIPRVFIVFRFMFAELRAFTLDSEICPARKKEGHRGLTQAQIVCTVLLFHDEMPLLLQTGKGLCRLSVTRAR